MRASGSALLIALLIGSAVGASPAPAHSSEGAGSFRPAAKPSASVLQRFDANHNGRLDAAEREALKKSILERLQPYRDQAIQPYDKNRNGVLEPGESQVMKQEREARRARIHARALSLYDANRNGVLDPGERQAMRETRTAFLQETNAQLLEHFDTNRNGVLDPAERDAVRGIARAKREQALATYDANHDGRISETERSAIPGGSPAASSAVRPPAPAGEVTAVAPRGGLSDVRVAPVGGRRGTQGVRIDFALGGSGNVSVKVFDPAGRLVRALGSREPMSAGSNSIRWDGTGQDGRAVSNGLYWISVEAFGQRVNRKVGIVR